MSNVFLNCTPPFLRGSFIQSRIYRFSWATWSVSPRSSYLPKNWIYRYVLPCSCCVLDLFARVRILVYVWYQIPPWVSRFHYLQEAQLVLCVLGSKLTLCSGCFTKPSSWPLSLTQATSLLPAYKMFNSCTNLIHPSRHTPCSEQLPRLRFLRHSSLSRESHGQWEQMATRSPQVFRHPAPLH